jgi:Domain of unknown function (DUF4375)
VSVLKSFPGYGGQTTQQLIALEGEFEPWTLVAAIEQGLCKKFGYGDSAELTAPERNVLAVLSLEREVMNGGYSQFFGNSSVEFVCIIVEALVEIGCPNTADLTKRAIDTLHLEVLTPTAAEAAAAQSNLQRDEVLDDYDQVFFKYEERPDLKLFSYISANLNSIRL